MPLDFPPSPSLNEIYTFGGSSWIWNGTAWNVYSIVSGNVVTQLNGLTGGVTLAAGSNVTLTPVGNTITISSAGGSGGGGATGATGPTGPQGNTGATGATGATGPVGDYVISLRGLTGAVGLTYGSGIGLSVSGNTLTFSNTGILSFNGLTGAVTGVTTGTENTFGPLQSFTNGISSSGGIFSALTRFNAGLSASFVRTPSIQGPGGADVIFDSGAIKLQQFGLPSNNTRLTASSTVDQTITLPDDTGTVALTKSVVSSFNGLTGSITGVSSIRGLTGAVGITNGSGIGLSVSGNTLTVSNTGVLSIDGSTGAISNVARTNVNNNFSAPQTISTTDPELVLDNTDNGNRTTFLSNSVLFSNIPGSLDQYLYASPTNPPNTITLPDFSTTLAGLAGTQTFTGTNTFSSLANFNAGISSAGGTFSALTRFNAGISASGATFSGPVNLTNTLLINGTQGSNNQVLTSTGSGITWATPAGGGGSVTSVNGRTGAVNFVAGTNISITPSGNTFTISASGGGGVDEAFVIAMATVL
jgi:hypothetical protein